MISRAPIIVAVVILGGACRDKLPTRDVNAVPHVQLDSTTTAEVIGLHAWTIPMIQDSLQQHAPGTRLDSPDIAQVLRDKLHFADAAVHSNTVVFDENEATEITIALREPTDSARVHYAPQKLDSIARVVEWKPFTKRLADTAQLRVVANRQLRGPWRDVIDSSVKGRPVTTQVGYAFESASDSAESQPIVDALAARNSEHDFTTAMQTVDHSTSIPDRIIAVLVLANFPARDDAWRALLKVAVGQRQAGDAMMAQEALDALSERAPRTVDWSPMASTVHDVLDGTALSALPSVAEALAATGASPKDAKAWLAHGGDMLTAFIESANPDVNEPAYALLTALRGKDLGADPEQWRAWIRSL